MKRTDLYNFIKEEIIHTLSEDTLLDKANEYVATHGDATPENLAKVLKISLEQAKELINKLSVTELTVVTKDTKSDEVNAIAKAENTNNTTVQNAVNAAKKSGKDVNIAEMARQANNMKVGDAEKFEAAKDLYEGNWIAKLLDLVKEAGEDGISIKDLAEKLGKKDPANVNPAIQELKMIGAIAPTREKAEKPAPKDKEAPKEKEVIAVAGDKEDADVEVGDEEDTFHKVDKEFDAPEVEPTAADIKKSDKLAGKGFAKTLSPEDEEKYQKLRKGMEAKIKKILAMPKAKRGASDDMKILRQLLTRDDVKKLFKDKGVSLKDFASDINK